MNKRLVAFRASKNYSITTMAKEIGVSKSYYEKIEYGTRGPSFNFIFKMRTRFPEADIDSLFFTPKSHDMCAMTNE